ncbi:MAG: sulfatase [Desulfobacteraceae bacterium 4572_89]|nr:MAG: sulfatase [Desulfobacteraceae bacterium 4572_89]
MKSSSFLQSRPPVGTIIIFLAFFWILISLSQAGQANEHKITNTLGMTFILVKPGSFMMGSPETEQGRDANEILHEIKIKRPYYLQTTEVTLKQWRSIMGKKWLRKRSGTGDIPVTRVSYYDCLKFINKLNKKKMGVYRLPTEAEWEYACRAGTTTAYHWGNSIDCSRAMYGNNTKKSKTCILFFSSMNIPPNGPAPVKTFAPNPWGFYDMHGNVWEWCADEYTDYLTHKKEKGYSTMESETRIRRGGSWFKYEQSLRSANRAYAHPGAKFITTGFRLVRGLE